MRVTYADVYLVCVIALYIFPVFFVSGFLLRYGRGAAKGFYHKSEIFSQPLAYCSVVALPVGTDISIGIHKALN